MTQTDLEKYQIIESELSQKVSEKVNNLLEGFCREHNCKVQPVIFYAPSVVGQPAVISSVQFQCISDERIAQIKREQNPTIISPNGKFAK